MRSSRLRRRAYIMTLVLAVMTVVGGFLALLSYYSASYYRNHQADRVRLTMRAVTDSVVSFTRTQASQWREQPPEEPISVDIAPLLPASTEGSAVISFPASHDGQSCHVIVRITRSRYQAADEFDLELTPHSSAGVGAPKTGL